MIPVYMLRIRILLEKLLDLGNRRKVPNDEAFDFGYLTHLMTCEVFNHFALKPFAVTNISLPYVTVIGYMENPIAKMIEHPDVFCEYNVYKFIDWSHPDIKRLLKNESRFEILKWPKILNYVHWDMVDVKEFLHEQAYMFADPPNCSAIDWERFDIKEMPRSWREGMRVDFEISTLPVERYVDPRKCRTVEMDAFLRAKDSSGRGITRRAVYNRWIRKQLCESGGVRVENLRITDTFQKKLARSTHWKYSDRPKYRFITRTVAEAVGRLQIANSDLFRELIRLGVGSHKAFGFGMLRVCAPGTHVPLARMSH